MGGTFYWAQKKNSQIVPPKTCFKAFETSFFVLKKVLFFICVCVFSTTLQIKVKYFYFLSKGLLYKYIAPQTPHYNCIHGKLDTVKFTDDVTGAQQ